MTHHRLPFEMHALFQTLLAQVAGTEAPLDDVQLNELESEAAVTLAGTDPSPEFAALAKELASVVVQMIRLGPGSKMDPKALMLLARMDALGERYHRHMSSIGAGVDAEQAIDAGERVYHQYKSRIGKA